MRAPDGRASVPRLVLAGLAALSAAWAAAGCDDAVESRGDEGVAAVVGSAGATLRAPDPSAIAGTVLTVPPDAFAEPTRVILRPAADDTALPPRARAVGPQVELVLDERLPAPAGVLELTLPFESARVRSYGQDHRKVKVWRRVDATWSLTEPIATEPGFVTIETAEDAAGTIYAAGVRLDGE